MLCYVMLCYEIARALGPDRCMALPMVHAFKGCNTVSFFEEEVKELNGIQGQPTMTLHQHFQCSLATTPESLESFIKPL